MITASEMKLIRLGEFDPLPSGGINYQIYCVSGHVHDSTKNGWDPPGGDADGPVSLKISLARRFGMEFYPGSLNVRTIQKGPWFPPKELNPRRVLYGIFKKAQVFPVVLNEQCIGIIGAVEFRGFHPDTGKMIKEMKLGDKVEMSQIYSPINIRERLNLEDKTKSDSVKINARLLSGDLLGVVYENRSQ